jgi:hypothetical protein
MIEAWLRSTGQPNAPGPHYQRDPYHGLAVNMNRTTQRIPGHNPLHRIYLARIRTGQEDRDQVHRLGLSTTMALVYPCLHKKVS